MELIQVYAGKVTPKVLSRTMKKYFFGYINKHAEVFESINRQLTPYGDNCLPLLSTEVNDSAGTSLETEVESPIQIQRSESTPDRNRFSVLYLRHDQYHHVGCSTYQQAQTMLESLAEEEERAPVGIYDDKTELFEWEPNGQQVYNQASIGEQGKRAEEIIRIAQSLRRRDVSWQTGEFMKPSFFA
ncbi:hypothetical protein [Telluribacter sp. SYSU D00476]|uniref:hypothetical protein n=1 Tax=Telluribacter sp. SYSU D00476 TaxID=2811430 RepID=UPI001FF11030|nr:hypothetical protein [Telluribacter sp. SYSU D00476]